MSLLGKWFGFARDEVFEEGMAAYDRGEYEEAIDAFEECLDDADPSIARLARFYLADSHSQAGQKQLAAGSAAEALECFESALRLNPDYPDLNLGAARACRELGQAGRARVFLRRALRKNPRYGEAMALEAALIYEDGQYAEGLDRAAEVLESEPCLGSDRYRAALDAHERGDHASVVRLLVSLTTTVGDAGVHRMLGDCLARDADWEGAAKEYAAAVAQSAADVELRCRLGHALYEVGHYAEAAKHLEEAIQLNDGHAEAHARLALVYRCLDQPVFAVREHRRAYELNPDHPLVVRDLGRAYLK